MAAYRRLDGFKSPAGWLPEHRDQLRAQRSVTSMGEFYLYLLAYYRTYPEKNETECVRVNASVCFQTVVNI